MDNATLINVLIMIIMSLTGVVMAIILRDIRSVRERLHKIEGGHSSMLAHVEMLNKGFDSLRDVHVRLALVESKL